MDIPKLNNVVYLLTNPLGERYIGSAGDLRHRMGEHRRGETGLRESVAKYGWENHTLTILEQGLPDEILRAREEEFIRKLKPEINKMKWCGGRLHHAESSKRKISASKKGAPAWNKGVSPSLEVRAKMSDAKRGKKRSPESVAKTAAGNRGKKRTPEQCERIGASNRGKKRTPEQRARMREVQLGKKQSPETIAKRVATRRANKYRTEKTRKLF